jgi:hypothetical protein
LQWRRIAPTFKGAAKQVHAETVASLTNARHAASWLTSIEANAVPVFGNRPVDLIATSDVPKLLAPICLTKSATARRVRQRSRLVLATYYFNETNKRQKITHVVFQRLRSATFGADVQKSS